MEQKSQATTQAQAQTEVNGNGKLKARRRILLTFVLGTFAALGAAYWIYWNTVARYVEFTDDAYVGGNVVQITPQISGTVVAIGADDTQFVQAGQTLVQLDKADAQVALDQAEAQLAKTVRDVRNLFATSAQLQANVAMRQSDLAKADEDLARRERLASSGAIAAEELNHARDAVTSAQAGLLAAQKQLAANRALVDRTTVENHPDVQKAAAQVKDAYLGFARTSLPAPVAGFVAKRNVQVGQRVGPGAALMAVVPLNEVWVDANFKEAQMSSMRAGQPVKLTADLYGAKVEYRGRVLGFGAGTGAAFALLPAQNATGNWIKVVQRVPVRVALDAQELASHPLQIGLSMQAEVDTHDRSGGRLPQSVSAQSGYETKVFDAIYGAANQRIAAIIDANSGGGANVADGGRTAVPRDSGSGNSHPAQTAKARLARGQPL